MLRLVLENVTDVKIFGVVTLNVVEHCCTVPVWVEIAKARVMGAVEVGFLAEVIWKTMFDCPYDVMALLMVTVSLLPPTLFEQVAEQLAVELMKLDGTESLHSGKVILTIWLMWTDTNGVSVKVHTEELPTTLELLVIVHPVKFAGVKVSWTDMIVWRLIFPALSAK
jgi:hypothetical protein